MDIYGLGAIAIISFFTIAGGIIGGFVAHLLDRRGE